MPRPSTDELRTRLATLIGAGASGEAFTDDELEGFLDAHRTFVRGQRWLVGYTASGDPGGPSWVEYVSDLDAWEADAKLWSGTAEAEPDNADYLAGVFSFDVARTDRLTITGSTFDLYAAARDALLAYAAKVKHEADVGTEATRIDRSQKAKAAMELAKEYGKRVRMGGVQAVRTDQVPRPAPDARAGRPVRSYGA